MSRRVEQRAEQRGATGFQTYRDTGDKFSVDNVPDGFTYEWKRQTYVGKEDRRNLVDAARNRWAPVPAERHPELASDVKDGTIVVDGLVLMERPEEITRQVRDEDRRMAKGQVRHQIERLHLVPEGTLSERGRRNVQVNKERDLSIPEDAGEEA